MINKYFLAKMNIPAYLKKFLYNRYYGYIIEGVPPITFQGNGENLLDYRIDGAVGGVGDRTKNLFDYSTVTRGYRITWSTGINQADPSAIMSDFIAVSNGIYRTSISVNLIGYDINKNYIGTYNANNKSFKKEYGPKTTYYEIADNNVKFVKLLSYSSTDTISQNTMFSIGSTILEYEPYGYKVPVVCGGITTNIYLDKPIYAKANIPSEYTEVEYIESTGTQYINTNIIPTNTTGVEAKITICNDNNRDNVFMGCRDTANGDNRYWIDVDWTSTDTLIFGFNNNTPANERYLLKGSDVGKSFIISMNYMNDRTGKINGITYDTSISSKTLAFISKPIYIFAGNRSGNAAYQYSGKLYNFKITDGTNVIRNFVPCYRNSDNVAGLYDLVNNVFYTNQGSENFIVGPIKENESISLSDTNTNIPTIRGTNVLTVDTTVQPSNVYIKVGGG